MGYAGCMREFVMLKFLARCGLALGGASLSAAAFAGPSLCIDTITEIELLHRVRQDAYFAHNAALGRRLRIEYDGCGYRIHVGEGSPDARGSDLLLVDRYGRVTNVMHQR
jgi:hypothetical protein